MRKLAIEAGLALALLSLTACGSSTPLAPTPVSPNVAGTYQNYQMWLVQFVRPHDGYNGSFQCSGTVTLAQAPGSPTVSGFAVVGEPCPAISFSLTGTVEPGGSLSFTTGGPRPPAGSCPAPSGVLYSGTITGQGQSNPTNTNHELSMRGSTSVNCPGPGEGQYNFDIIMDGFQTS